MKRIKLVCTLLIVVLSFLYCSRNVITRKYYILESNNDIQRQNLGIAEPFPYTVDIRDFRVAKAFDNTQIALRSESHELNYYFYHHWAVRPAAAISGFVYNSIDRAGIFKRCSSEHSLDPDYLITGLVHAMERIQIQDSVAAHLHATLQLINIDTDSEVLRYEFDRSVELIEDNSMNTFAGALSDVITQETDEFIRRIIGHFQAVE